MVEISIGDLPHTLHPSPPPFLKRTYLQVGVGLKPDASQGQAGLDSRLCVDNISW